MRSGAKFPDKGARHQSISPTDFQADNRNHRAHDRRRGTRGFSQRLRTALDQAGWKAMGATPGPRIQSPQFRACHHPARHTQMAAGRGDPGPGQPAGLGQLARSTRPCCVSATRPCPRRPRNRRPHPTSQGKPPSWRPTTCGWGQEQRIVESLIALLLGRSGATEAPVTLRAGSRPAGASLRATCTERSSA